MKTIKLATRGPWRQVRAFVFGSWAVHRCVPVDVFDGDTPSGWAISHIPSGLSLANFVHDLERDDAVRIARALDDSGELRRDRSPGDEHRCLVTAIVGAALHSHYVGRRGR